MACLCYFAGRADEVLLVEQLTGLYKQLTAYDLFIKAVVTVDDHVVDGGLWSLDHSHLKGDWVAVYVLLDGYELIEEITLILIDVGYVVVIALVGVGALLENLLVVDIAGLHVEHIVKEVARIDGVAHPVDWADVVLLALFKGDVDVDGLVVVGDYAVAQDFCVTVALFVILFDDAVQVVLEVAFNKLLLAEEVDELALLVGLLHRALDGVVAQHLVAVDVDFVYLHLVVLVDIDVDNVFAGCRQVGSLLDAHIGVTEALLRVEGLYYLLCAVYDVGGYLVTLHQLQLLFEILALTAACAVVVYGCDAGLRLQCEFEPHLVAIHLLDLYLNRREESLTGKSFCGVGYVVTGYFDEVAYVESRVSYHDVVLVVGYSGYLDACDFVGARHSGVDYLRVVDGVSGGILCEWTCTEESD